MRLFPAPGPGRRRQLISLALLVAVLAGLAWYRLRPTAPAARASNPALRSSSTPDPLTLPEPVKLDRLELASGDAEVGRNPFVFGARPAPPPPPPPVYHAPAPVPIAPPVPEGPPPIALRLNGLMEDPRTGRTMATLRDPASGTLFQVYEGDIVDGRYRVVKVGLQSVVVSYVDGSGARTLPLGG
jgi:hypothetical protein